jgi:hypothetical protein
MRLLSTIFLASLIFTAPSLNEVKQTMPFKVLVPHISQSQWELIVNTYPKDNEKQHEYLGLHYIDNNKELIVGIIESKVSKNNIEHFEEEKLVDINGNNGYFTKWVAPKKGVSGGELSWIQGSTHIRMTSFKLTEKEMVKIARTME